MRVIPVKFEPWHLAAIVEAEPGELPDNLKDPQINEYLASLDNSWSLLRADGAALWCGGTIPQWPGRHLGWSYVSQHAGPYMTRVTRKAIAVLNQATGRTEITVKADFAEGHRWAKLLGFEVETPLLRAYGPDGEDHVGYVRFVE